MSETNTHTHTYTYAHALLLAFSLSLSLVLSLPIFIRFKHDITHLLKHIHKKTHQFERHDQSVRHMVWLRLVGSLKLQVSFAKELYKTDDILQKRLIILRSLLFVATPYLIHVGYESFIWNMTHLPVRETKSDSLCGCRFRRVNLTDSYGTCLVHTGRDSFAGSWD